MFKISMFVAGFTLIGIGTWAIWPSQQVAAATPGGIDPLQMMTNATDLPATHYVDYSLIFN
jgi:hypothetical protein